MLPMSGQCGKFLLGYLVIAKHSLQRFREDNAVNRVGFVEG